MSIRSVSATARRVACPTCGVPRFEYCVHSDGSIRELSHPARTAAARLASSVSPAVDAALRRLHVSETAYIDPAVRRILLRDGLVTSPDGRVGPQLEPRRGRRPKERLPLTDAGRAAIGVTEEEVKAS